MIGFLLILLSASTGITEATLIKQYNKKHSAGGFIFTAIVSLFSMMFFVLRSIVTGFSFSFAVLPYAIISGILYCTASLLTYIALKIGPFAISMLILSYSLIFPIFYGLMVLKEKATVFTYIGLILIAVSLFLVRGEHKGGEEKRKFSFSWLICIGLSVACAGMFSVLSRMQQVRFNNAFNNAYMIITIGSSAVVLFIIGILKDKKDVLPILKSGSPYAVSAGLANGVTNFLGLVIFNYVAVSVSAPTGAGVKSVLSFLLSFFLFKERFIPRQIVGVALGAAAVVLLNI